MLVGHPRRYQRDPQERRVDSPSRSPSEESFAYITHEAVTRPKFDY